MVYNNKFVVALKVDGKVLREFGSTIYLPFGKEYSLYLKNLNTVNAVVTVSVDGTDATDGYELIVPAGEAIELEGWMKGTKVSHKFKFIEKTRRIEKYRGNKILDGLVCVTFRFEKKSCININEINFPYQKRFGDCSGFSTGTPNHMLKTSSSDIYSYNASCDCCASYDVNEEGITTKGGFSDQSFSYGSVGNLEQNIHSIIFKIKGITKNNKKNCVKKPLVVKQKVRCDICGKKNKSSHKFCTECGTSLI